MRQYLLIFIVVLAACGAQTTPASQNTSAPVAQPAAPTTRPLDQATARPIDQPTTQPSNNPSTQQPNYPDTITYETTESLASNGDRVLGKPDAPVALGDYSDFL